MKSCELDVYETLLSELRFVNPIVLNNFLRMSTDYFEYLLQLVEHLITISNAKMYRALSIGERLYVTLKLLATGMYKIIKN